MNVVSFYCNYSCDINYLIFSDNKQFLIVDKGLVGVVRGGDVRRVSFYQNYQFSYFIILILVFDGVQFWIQVGKWKLDKEMEYFEKVFYMRLINFFFDVIFDYFCLESVCLINE